MDQILQQQQQLLNNALANAQHNQNVLQVTLVLMVIWYCWTALALGIGLVYLASIRKESERAANLLALLVTRSRPDDHS